jgi:hypothetical protein
VEHSSCKAFLLHALGQDSVVRCQHPRISPRVFCFAIVIVSVLCELSALSSERPPEYAKSVCHARQVATEV